MRIAKKILLFMTIGLLIFLAITVFIPFLNFSFQSKALPANAKKVQFIAHRGASGSAPENTMAAFNKALKEGADMIELDVHLSKDGALVVLHDNNFKRTTGVEGAVADWDLAAIKKLNAGANEKIPTLDEVLQLVNGRAKVLIELKWPTTGIYEHLVSKTLACIATYKAQDWVVLQSFEQKYLKEIIATNPQLECHQLIFGYSNILPVYFDTKMRLSKFEPLKGVKSVNLFYMYLTKSWVKRMHSKGLKVMTFTLNDEAKASKAMQMGVDGIISDNAGLLKKLQK